MEQIFSVLRKNGLVIGRKGSQGGYSLAKPASELTVGQILRALEGELVLVDVKENPDTDRLEKCINENLWNVINDNINKYFNSITLEDLVNKYMAEKENIIYYI